VDLVIGLTGNARGAVVLGVPAHSNNAIDCFYNVSMWQWAMAY